MVLRLCAFFVANAAIALAGAAERPADPSDASPVAGMASYAPANGMAGGSASAAAGTVAAQLTRRAPARGTLLSGPTLVQIDAVTDTLDKLEPPLLRSLLKRRDGLLDITGEPRCTITIHSLRYQTLGGQGEPSLVSGEGSGPERRDEGAAARTADAAANHV